MTINKEIYVSKYDAIRFANTLVNMYRIWDGHGVPFGESAEVLVTEYLQLKEETGLNATDKAFENHVMKMAREYDEKMRVRAKEILGN